MIWKAFLKTSFFAAPKCSLDSLVYSHLSSSVFVQFTVQKQCTNLIFYFRILPFLPSVSSQILKHQLRFNIARILDTAGLGVLHFPRMLSFPGPFSSEFRNITVSLQEFSSIEKVLALVDSCVGCYHFTNTY